MTTSENDASTLGSVDEHAAAPKRRVADLVLAEVTRYIESNDLPVGAKLPSERVLVDMLGVSRSSLREALRALSAMGAVTIRQGDGMYVASTRHLQPTNGPLFDATEQYALRSLIETRQGIEVAAVRAAAQRASDDDLAGLQNMLDDQLAALSHDPNFVWTPLEFELAIMTVSGNSWLYNIEIMLRDAWLTLSSGLRASVGRHAEWHAEHRAILASLRSRNVPQAERLVMAHLSLERFEDDIRTRTRFEPNRARRATPAVRG